MAIKELMTRIQLKHDSYSAWTTAPGKDLVLLPGELAICEIPSTNDDSQIAPTVLFKVGNGTSTFEELPWASATAADVYSWAKASDVQLDGKTIKFVGTDKTITLDYITEAEVKSKITDALDKRISDIEESLGDGGSVADQLEAIDSRLDVLEGTEEGSVAKAVADAVTEVKAYADTAETDAVASAKTYTDTEVKKNTDRIEVLETAKTEHASSIAANAKAISDETTARTTAISGVETAYKAADKAIEDKIGTGFDEVNTVAKAIADVITAAGSDAAAKVEALANGQVATNKTNIEANAKAISDLEDALETEATTREEEDNKLDERLVRVEAFFKTAEDETLDTALDTLKEIQVYLNGEGEATGGMIGRIAENEKDIKALQDTLADGGDFEKRIDAAEEATTAVANRATTLENVVKGYTEEGSVKAAIEAAQKAGTDAAAVADGKAVAAQNTADAVKAAVENTTTGLAATKAIADKNVTDIAAITTRVGNNESAITALQNVVANGDNTNDKLRADITALQEITGDASKGNEQLRTELTALQNVVNDSTTGLAKTKAIADAAATQATTNDGRLKTIEADYLKKADEFIFNCGTSSAVVHKVD